MQKSARSIVPRDCPLRNIPDISDQKIVLNVPSNVSNIDTKVLMKLKGVNISEKNAHIAATDQLIYSRSGELLGKIGEHEEIMIPKEITHIKACCFMISHELEYVTFEEGSLLEEIERFAFRDCTSLHTVSFAGVSNLKVIGEGAFSGCSSLSLKIPISVSTIGRSAFKGVPRLDVEEGNKHFSTSNGLIFNRTRTTLHSFYGTEREIDISIPYEVEVIAEGCFRRYDGKARLSFEEGSRLSTIEDGAFKYSNFAGIEIPGKVSEIGKGCFNKANLHSIVFQSPSLLDVFSESMFNMSDLKSIVIPATVTELGCECFHRCWALESVSVEPNSSLVCIRSNCFKHSRLLASFDFINCKKLRYIERGAFRDTKLTTVMIHGRM